MKKEEIIWITGASSGIGEALSKEWAKKGKQIIISSRKKEELERVKSECERLGAEVHIEVLDLANPTSVSAACDNVLSKFQAVDYLFLNGGLSQRAYAKDSSLEMDRNMMEINYFGNINLAKSMLPSMKKNGGGHFVVTTSLTGKFGIPLRSSYAASKHALHGFFDTLRAEEVDSNIKVTIVCPGFIRTDISKNALGPDGKPTGKMDEAQNAGMSPEKCAEKMISASRKNKKEVYIGGKEISMVYFRRYLPSLYYYLASRVKPN